MKPHCAASVFQVANVDSALQYYKEVLGFSEDFRFGDYAGVKFGEACIHLCGHSVHKRPVGGGTIYIFCDEVDSYHAEIAKKGAVLKSAPRDYDYGMRDFMTVDLDGNHLAFGCETKKGLTPIKPGRSRDKRSGSGKFNFPRSVFRTGTPA